MKESYRKGVANRPDPESCATHRKMRREALTGAHAGWVLSPEKRESERRRCQAEAPIKGAGQAKRKARQANRNREISSGSAGSQTPCMHGNSMHGNQEIPVPPAAVRKQWAGGGTHKGTLLVYGVGK